MEFLQGLNLQDYLLAATSLIATCAAIAALTPSPKDDAFFGKVRKLIDLLAMNFGNAKNEEKKEEE